MKNVHMFLGALLLAALITLVSGLFSSLADEGGFGRVARESPLVSLDTMAVSETFPGRRFEPNKAYYSFLVVFS